MLQDRLYDLAIISIKRDFGLKSIISVFAPGLANPKDGPD